ncbi:MAG: hypothetical protein ACFCGT_07360 [Sandaracinaceae bacterium]
MSLHHVRVNPDLESKVQVEIDGVAEYWIRLYARRGSEPDYDKEGWLERWGSTEDARLEVFRVAPLLSLQGRLLFIMASIAPLRSGEQVSIRCRVQQDGLEEQITDALQARLEGADVARFAYRLELIR